MLRNFRDAGGAVRIIDQSRSEQSGHRDLRQCGVLATVFPDEQDLGPLCDHRQQMKIDISEYTLTSAILLVDWTVAYLISPFAPQ